MSEKQLVIGRIPFLVAIGFFHLEEKEDPFTYFDGTPEQLNRALNEGTVDLAPASSFEYLRHFDRYVLLPDFCTSGVAAVRSALLFSRVPWEKFDRPSIALTPDSASAAALLKILLRRDSIEPSFRTGEPEGTDTAHLLIGNRALIVDQENSWEYRYDLCTLWNRWQHLPFPFGAWIVRKEAADHPDLPRWRHHLSRSVESFRADPSAALRRWQQRHSLPETDLRLDNYWETLEYRMGPDHHTALERFAELACEAGLLKRRPKIEYLPSIFYPSHS